MRGWKIVRQAEEGQFSSRFTRRFEYHRFYGIGVAVESADAPMFFFADELQGIDLALWPMQGEGHYALLRIEASGTQGVPVRPMARVAQDESEYAEFWARIFAGEEWEAGRAFLAPAKTLTAPRILPLAFVWAGQRAGRPDAEIAEEIEAAMMPHRSPPPILDKEIFLPFVRA